MRSFRLMLSAAAAVAALTTSHAFSQDGKPAAGTTPAQAADEKKDDAKKDEAAIPLKLPKPAFKGTPKDVPPGTNLEPPRKGPRPEFMAPKGVKLLSKDKPVKASDNDPIIGTLKYVTNGDKEATEGSYVELGPGLQWVQIDLGKEAELYAVVVWHYHNNARVYHDVIVQIADDADFLKNVRTVFNNDHDNSAGLGVGTDLEFWETYEGKLVDCKAQTGRYVRLYSKGSTADDQNHYTEVEVFGKE